MERGHVWFVLLALSLRGAAGRREAEQTFLTRGRSSAAVGDQALARELPSELDCASSLACPVANKLSLQRQLKPNCICRGEVPVRLSNT